MKDLPHITGYYKRVWKGEAMDHSTKLRGVIACCMVSPSGVFEFYPPPLLHTACLLKSISSPVALTTDLPPRPPPHPAPPPPHYLSFLVKLSKAPISFVWQIIGRFLKEIVGTVEKNYVINTSQEQWRVHTSVITSQFLFFFNISPYIFQFNNR